MNDQPPQKTTRNVLIILGITAIASCFFLFSYTEITLAQLLSHLEKILASGDHLRDTVLEYGPVAPLLFILIQILQVVFAPVPGEATGALGGYLFGAFPGFIYSTVALTVGSGIAFSIGHLFKDMLRDRYQGTKIYRTFHHLVHKGEFTIPFVLFLFPGFPKDILSYLLGMSLMPFKVFLFIAGIARIPGTLMLSFQGAKVYQEEYYQLLLLLVVSIAISLPCYIYRKNILAFLNQYNNSAEDE